MRVFGPSGVKKLEEKRDIAGLVNALGNDKDPMVRQAAAGALCRIGEATAVEPLISSLKDRDSGVRLSVVWALGEIGDPRAVEPLISALKDGDVYVRRAVLVALREIGDPRAVAPVIATLAHYNDPLSHCSAYSLLGKAGDPRAIEPLIAALDIQEPMVQEAAARALDELAWKPNADEIGAKYWIARGQWSECVAIGAHAINPLIAALPVLDEDRIRVIIETLGKIGAPAVKPLIALLDSHVGSAAAHELELLGWKPEANEDGAKYWIERGQLSECVAIGAPAIGPLIAELEGCWDKDKRQPIVETLGKIGAPAVKPLIDVLYAQDGRAGDAAVALGKVGAPAIQPLIDALRGGRVGVLEDATAALGTIGAPAVQALIEALRAASDRSMRKAVAEVLVEMYPILDKKTQAQVLVQRDYIRSPHVDERQGSYSCSHNEYSHTDEHADVGVGVDFPI